MLTVYRGNRAELLAQVLAAQLCLEPPDPFETVQVVVNTWPTSRWLGEQLALHLGGIAANLRFPFPGSHLRTLVNTLLEAPPDQDPWRATSLVWPLLDLLPSIAAGPEGGVLADWWQGRDPGRRLDAAGWQLARSIADAFDDYALYRPEMLAQWEAGRLVDGADRPLEASLRWQPLLYAALRDRLGVAPFGLRVEQVIERLRRGLVPAATLPGRLRLFGLSSMAPVQVRLLQALAGSTAVDLYLLTPCGDLWQRCSDRRRELSDALALAEPLDDQWLLEAPGLDARFGRLGAEFQQLLEGSGEAQLGLEREQDLFFAAATVAEQSSHLPSPPLLAQLQ
ncbi:MAG: exodeoxyribonuclease V subunit gamma, partial [Cyanobacteriota bacterium]